MQSLRWSIFAVKFSSEIQPQRVCLALNTAQSTNNPHEPLPPQFRSSSDFKRARDNGLSPIVPHRLRPIPSPDRLGHGQFRSSRHGLERV